MSNEPYTELSPKGTFYIHKKDGTCIKLSDGKITTITEEE